ncbi:MAG: hypothetical protein JRG71_16715 [Deltaproteobacteria bacterium]|nr:hypothetical protein [Deltaproteobacteria bacterium]
MMVDDVGWCYGMRSTLMASQKVRPPALQRLFKTLTYNMYAFTLEQPLRLGGRSFCLLAI